MGVQPVGTVTLLFTDVEGSTQLLGRLGTSRYAEVLELHRRLLREAFGRHGGFEVGTEGDSFFVAFERAEAAVAAAGEAQRAIAGATWPEGGAVRVRMGVHTGEPAALGGSYVGMDVHQAARIMSAGHGGQVLVSDTTAALLNGVALRDLGPHRLKDLLAPIQLYQLELEGVPGEFPPLRSLQQTNLPVAAWPLLGREPELEKIRAFVAEGVRLVTLTGPGGSGKTRLALQAAAELSDEFRDGVFFVALAPLRDAGAVQAAVAEAVGLQPDDDVAAWLASRRVLLVLDNLEHLPGVASPVRELLVGATTVLSTSRMSLRLSAERELPVEPLPSDAAVELFVSRAAAAGRQVAADETVAAVCRRLDNLPLALELAAARAKLLSPAALLQRLDAALPLLTGGAQDLPERQRTLRATIEWSHDLLDSDAQAAFRRLSVFRGSFTLDAAEAITGADIDQIATLLDQSLLKPLGDDRFFLLETIREYASERLDQAGEASEYGLRHAHAYLARLEADHLEQRREEMKVWFAAEEDNLRAALDRLTADAAIVDAARLTQLLNRFWVDRGALTEERQRIHSLLDRDDLPDKSRVGLLGCLSELELRVGDLKAQEEAARQALPLVDPGTYAHGLLLIDLGLIAARSGRSDEAVSYAHQLLAEAPAISESITERQRLGLQFDAGNILGEAGQTDAARSVIGQVLGGFQRISDDDGEAVALTTLAQLDLYAHQYERARAALVQTLATARRIGHTPMETEVLRDLGLSLIGLERRSEARAMFAELLALSTADGMQPSLPLVDALDGIALAADAADADRAAQLRGVASTIRTTANLANAPNVTELTNHFEQHLIDTLGPEAWEQEHALGAALGPSAAIELARSLAPTQPGTRIPA